MEFYDDIENVLTPSNLMVVESTITGDIYTAAGSLTVIARSKLNFNELDRIVSEATVMNTWCDTPLSDDLNPTFKRIELGIEYSFTVSKLLGLTSVIEFFVDNEKVDSIQSSDVYTNNLFTYTGYLLGVLVSGSERVITFRLSCSDTTHGAQISIIWPANT